MAMAGGIRRGQARGTPRGLTWRELAGTMGCPVSGSGDDGAVRPGVGWRAVVLEIWPETPILPKPLFSWRRLPM